MITMPVPMVSHDKKSHIAPQFDCLDLGNAMVLLTMLSASHDTESSAYCVTRHQCQWHHVMLIPWHHMIKSYVASYFTCLSLYCHWWYSQHHMTLVPVPMTSHYQKVIFHLILTVLTKGMQHCHYHYYWSDSNAGANGVIWTKSHVSSSFKHPDLTCGMVPLMTLGFMWC